MKAITLHQFGETDQFALEEVPAPSIKGDEVLVEVKAISINPVDTIIRAGKGFAQSYKTREKIIIGWDIAGIVTETGSQVSRFKKGDGVFGMIRFPENGEAYAEYVAAPADHLAKIPANIGFEEAAGATLAALTAWQALINNAIIQPGNKVLIHAAAGGVGHFAIQIAKHFGAYVIATSSDEKKDFVLGLGADEHIDYQNQVFEEVVKDNDVVLDAVGGEVSYRSLDAVKKGGLVITILAIAKDLPEKAEAAGKRGQIFRVTTSGEDMENISKLLASGALKTHIYQSYPFEQMAEAHKQVETRRTTGKVVVTRQ